MTAIRLLAALTALFLSLPALAVVTVAERSPFAQGHWWDPSRSGHGFEIFNAADQVALVWYTYDEAGNPVWYNAQAAAAGMGQPMPLQRQRWVNSRLGTATIVGSIKLSPRHPESMQVEFDIGGNRGTWTIKPFIAAGVISETDHTGHWYDPAQSGWGFTLTEQGPVLGSVLYTYDAAGAPTWAAGFGRRAAERTVDMFSTTGYCPYCTPRVIANRALGTLRFDYDAEARLTVRNGMSLAMATGVSVEGARAMQLGRPASWRPADRQLAAFSTAAALEAYLREGIHGVAPMGINSGIDFSPAPAAASTPYSQTNLQEQGVDEADVVKTDGRSIYTFMHNSTGQRIPSIRILDVLGDGAQVAERGVAGLVGDGVTAIPMANAGLFLHGDKLAAVTGNVPISTFVNAWFSSSAWAKGKTHVEILSASNPAAARWRMELDGYLVTSRRIGDRLYLVTRFIPDVPGFRYMSNRATSVEFNQALVDATPFSGFLPKIRINGGAPTVAVAPESVYTPPPGSREPLADMILITAIDLAQPGVAQVLGIIGMVETVYASPVSLYVTTTRASLRSANGALLANEPGEYMTDIHKLSLGASAMTIAGSASVEGFLSTEADRAPFRMSEHQGRLRVVTSSQNSGWWGNDNRNRLTILEPSSATAGLLKTVGYLPNDQRPEPLGKPNEILYGTRFLGDRLYAVTFRQVDPLYVVDLASASDPKITGALEVPGFSEYLHPLPDGMLLGFGMHALPSGQLQGLQVSLFDVRDAGKPRQLQRFILGEQGSGSALLKSHHALAALVAADGSGTIAFPARLYEGQAWSRSGLMRFQLAPSNGVNQLVPLAPLITHTKITAPWLSSTSAYLDSTAFDGRSIIFPNGTIYVGNGQVWRQDAAGISFGPN